MRVDLCEKPDVGPSKVLGYYKVPLRPYVDYVPEVRRPRAWQRVNGAGGLQVVWAVSHTFPPVFPV